MSDFDWERLGLRELDALTTLTDADKRTVVYLRKIRRKLKTDERQIIYTLVSKYQREIDTEASSTTQSILDTLIRRAVSLAGNLEMRERVVLSRKVESAPPVQPTLEFPRRRKG